MPSNIPRNTNFAVIRHAFPGRTPGIQLEIPTAWRFHSLKSASTWIRSLGHPMGVLAFVSIEILDDRLSKRSRELMDRCANDSPDQLILLANDSIIGFVQALSSLEGSVGNEDVIEKLQFHIFELPKGINGIVPGTYVEVSHGDNIADNVTWWRGTNEGLPGIIFGHVSIEIYRDTLLPDALSAVENKNHGEPEPLEALISSEVCKIIKRFITA